MSGSKAGRMVENILTNIIIKIVPERVLSIMIRDVKKDFRNEMISVSKAFHLSWERERFWSPFWSLNFNKIINGNAV